MEEKNVLPFVNPATGEQFGQVSAATPAEAHQAVCEMQEAASEWSLKGVRERVRILRKFQEVMIDSMDVISQVVTQDTGKSRQDSLIEVFMTADVLHQYLKHAPRWLRRERAPRGIFVFKRCYIEHRPYGAAAVIAPWNYPFALAMPPALSALLAGNTVLLKPSEVTSATGAAIEKLFQRAPDLAPFVRVLHGGPEIGAALVDARPDFIFLTGSTPTGKSVAQAAARRLIPVAFELGGKDAMIVLEDADVEAAARWGVWGATYNAGQTCMSVERIYVVERVYDEFVKKAVEQAGMLQPGYTLDKDSPYSVGPVSDPRQVQVIQRHLEDALEKGAQRLIGGGQEDMYIEPVVLVNVDHSMLVMQEETFGPVIPVVKVEDEAHAIRLANDCAYGLGASVWSSDIERAERVARRLEASSVIINDTVAQFGVSMLPFGGVKGSGYGRIHGKEGLMQFTRPYSYVVGGPPKPVDLIVKMREPGHYRLGAASMRALFGAGLKQRWEGVKGFVSWLVKR